MIRSLKVVLWNEEIGRLSWDDRRRTSYFLFNPEFTKKGLNITPLVAPLITTRQLMPVWGEEAKIYQKLPAFLADSLPDAWGNQLFDVWRQQNHLPNSEITPLDKLAFIGKRGMGAFEFIPELSHEYKYGKVDVKSLAALAERIFTDKEAVHILPDESVTMQSLLTVGTSAGGRQPKALIAINRKTGDICSGQIAGKDDYDYFLLKFGNSKYCSSELEMSYYEMAINAGINMMHSELFTVEGNRHFLTKRFDREDGRKIFTQTLAAVSPEADSYEQLIAVCRKLHLPETDCQEVFRRMVFNILANNTDDHNKNFSFIMSQRGEWKLSPAYDITYIINAGGFLPEEDHCLYVRAKLKDITHDDVIEFAQDNGIRRPEAIIRDVADSLKQFRLIAEKNRVAERWISAIETTINSHLSSWGLIKPETAPSFEISGKQYSNVRIERTYKGNFHLLYTLYGSERKFVIGKNKDEYALIDEVGVNAISPDQLRIMIEKYIVNE